MAANPGVLGLLDARIKTLEDQIYSRDYCAARQSSTTKVTSFIPILPNIWMLYSVIQIPGYYGTRLLKWVTYIGMIGYHTLHVIPINIRCTVGTSVHLLKLFGLLGGRTKSCTPIVIVRVFFFFLLLDETCLHDFSNSKRPTALKLIRY